MHITRRDALKAGALGLATTVTTHAHADAKVDSDFKITKGRIRQSVMGWCFKPMPGLELAKHCKAIGLEAMEGVSAEDYPAIHKMGLKISLVGSHGFKKGPFTKANHEFCARSLREGIDLAVAVKCPSVITFTGMREKGTSDVAGERNCVSLWKSVARYAEQKKISLVLEHLNTRPRVSYLAGVGNPNPDVQAPQSDPLVAPEKARADVHQASLDALDDDEQVVRIFEPAVTASGRGGAA